MKYFTTDTHFGHPLVTVLRGFTTFDPTRSSYEEILRAHGRKAAEDWAKETTLDSGPTFRTAAIRMLTTKRSWTISMRWSGRTMSCGFWATSVFARH